MKINTNTQLCLKATRSIRKGFTLIELLVVMAIIAVLAGISIGPVLGFLTKGKITETRSVCNDLRVSVESFRSEYSYLPFVGSHPDQDTNFETNTPSGVDFLEVLMGLESDVNDKQIAYFSAKRAKSSKNGLLYTGTGDPETFTALLDPWANPFTIRLDYDGDGKVDANELNSAFTGIQNLEAIIATESEDRTWEEENVTSW